MPRTIFARSVSIAFFVIAFYSPHTAAAFTWCHYSGYCTADPLVGIYKRWCVPNTNNDPIRSCSSKVVSGPDYQDWWGGFVVTVRLTKVIDSSVWGHEVTYRYNEQYITQESDLANCDIDATTFDCLAPSTVSVPEDKNLGKSCPVNIQGGNPIHLATGNKFQQEIDYVSSVDPRFRFSRAYNSLGVLEHNLGQGWQHNFDRKIVKRDDSNLLYVEKGGKRISISRPTGIWETDPDVNLRFSTRGDGFDVVDEHGKLERYRFDGELAQIVYPDGYTIDLHYDSSTGLLDELTDSFGQSIGLFYSDNNQLARIETPGARIWRYFYSRIGNLVSVVGPDGEGNSYHYENADYTHALTGISDARGIRYATYDYDAAARAIASYHAENADRVDIQYNADGSTTLTNSRNQSTIYTFVNNLGVWRVDSMSGPGCTTCGQ